MFHPGTVSYREISSNDSVHIAVTPENHVSVHVDRVSPLSTREGSASRYSPFRVLRHNVTHAIDSCARLWRSRPDAHRCEMDCEIVAVTDKLLPDSPIMFEFSCRAAGVEGCRWRTQAPSEEELLARIIEHLRAVHGVARSAGRLATDEGNGAEMRPTRSAPVHADPNIARSS